MSYEIDPDTPPSLDTYGLTPFELTVKDHWVRFYPDLVTGLHDQGPDALDEAIRRATWRMDYQVSLAMARDPNLSYEMAMHLHRDEVFRPVG